MAHFHGAEVGRHIVLEAGRTPNDRGTAHYAAYLRTTCPPRSPLCSSSPASASSPLLSSHRPFFVGGRDGSVCFDKGVLTRSLKVPQVMGRRFNERNFARVAESSEDVGDVGNDKAARGGPQGLDMAFTILEELAALFVSLAMSIASLDSEGGVKPTRITLRSFTLYSAASLAFFFISVRVSNQKHCRWASVFARAWRSCSSAHLLAVVFGTGIFEARSGREVEGLAAVGREPPWRRSGEGGPGFVELIVDEGREKLAVSESGRRRGD